MKKQFLPVIHVRDIEQVLRNVNIAKNNGSDGVFLINHGDIKTKQLVEFYEEALKHNPDFWIGLNCLDIEGYNVFKNVPDSVSGIWIDNGGIYGNNKCAKKILRKKKKYNFTGKYFGGVAFKGQERVKMKDLKKISISAIDFMDVITTSGRYTGIPPSVKKIALMKKTIGKKKLALASGISIENVNDYIQFVDYFLVSTGISSSFYELDPIKVELLSKKIHS